MRVMAVSTGERHEAASQFLESNARVSSLKRVNWNSWLRTVIKLFASVTSETHELKSRHNSGPAFIAGGVPQVFIM